MEEKKQVYFIITLTMKKIEFKNLDFSLVSSLVLFQKKFFKELNGNIFLEKEIIRNIKNKYFFTNLCLVENSIEGFILAQRILDCFEIHSLFISPGYRREGIANSLLGNFVKKCKKEKIDKITLEVMEFNNSAKKLYFKHKFKVYGERKNYYSVGERKFNGILMKLELK